MGVEGLEYGCPSPKGVGSEARDSSALSKTSLNIRPMALRGLLMVSPVFCRNLRASSEMVWAGVGVGRARG